MIYSNAQQREILKTAAELEGSHEWRVDFSEVGKAKRHLVGRGSGPEARASCLVVPRSGRLWSMDGVNDPDVSTCVSCAVRLLTGSVVSGVLAWAPVEPAVPKKGLKTELAELIKLIAFPYDEYCVVDLVASNAMGLQQFLNEKGAEGWALEQIQTLDFEGNSDLGVSTRVILSRAKGSLSDE